jgi:hypothetical protein
MTRTSLSNRMADITGVIEMVANIVLPKGVREGSTGGAACQSGAGAVVGNRTMAVGTVGIG